MPYTYYIQGPRGQWIAAKTIAQVPDSYFGLKLELEELAATRHALYGITEGPIKLMQHLGGAVTNKISGGNHAARAKEGGYRQASIHWRRKDEFSCTLIYNTLTCSVQVKSPGFGPHTYQMRLEYLMEMGKPCPEPSLVPRRSIDDSADALMCGPSQARYGDYHRRNRISYGLEAQRRIGLYSQARSVHYRSYRARNTRLRDVEQRRKH
jgi:hypothetical protein